ncbi:hypothetical protein BH09PSE6_BH09PSE6_27090 [soil metagenome]
MDGSRMFGRTVPGTQEILNKSGRLTQSERLVLIVLGDQIEFDQLLSKLPALARDRVERALGRLLELELAYEVLVVESASPRGRTIPVKALQAFLSQSDSDPVTIMATVEQMEDSQRMKVLQLDSGEVIEIGKTIPRTESATAASPVPVPVPLSKLFPEESKAPPPVIQDAAELNETVKRKLDEDRRLQRQKIQALEKDIGAALPRRTRSSGSSRGSRNQQHNGASSSIRMGSSSSGAESKSRSARRVSRKVARATGVGMALMAVLLGALGVVVIVAIVMH